MFYFFRRGDALLKCEVRPEGNDDGYELVIDRTGSMVQVERFRRASELNQRWTELEADLLRSGWRGPQPSAD